MPARSDVARQLTADGFHTPPADPESDCSMRLLGMIAQFRVIMSTKTGEAAHVAGDSEVVANLVHFAEMHGRMVLGDDDESANIIFNTRPTASQNGSGEGPQPTHPQPTRQPSEFPEGTKHIQGRKYENAAMGCGAQLDDAEEADWKKEQAGLDKHHTDAKRKIRWARCKTCIGKSRTGTILIFPDGFQCGELCGGHNHIQRRIYFNPS